MATAAPLPSEAELQAGVAAGLPVAAGGADVPASLIREVLLASPAGGLLWLQDAHVTGALDLSRQEVKAGMRFERCRFDQPVQVSQASIQGLLVSGGEIAGVVATQLHCAGDVLLRERVSSSGPLVLDGAHIEGNLRIEAATIAASGADHAVNGEGMRVEHSVEITGTGRIAGPVYLPFASLGAQLTIQGVEIVAAEGQSAVNGQGLEARGDVFVSDGVTVRGRVDFVGAVIHGDLTCAEATIHVDKGVALTADRADVGGALFLEKATITGEVRLLGTHVRDDLNCIGATLANPGGTALFARRAKLDKDVLFCDGFTASGLVDLVRVSIGGALRCFGGSFSAPGATALDLRGATIGGVFQLLPRERPDGFVDLLDAHCAVLQDRKDRWPDQVRLDGFQYGCFDPDSPTGVDDRLDWLRRNGVPGGATANQPDPYSARIYEQLITVLRASGNEEDARKVALERERQRAARRGRLLRPLNWLFEWTVGYGYATRRIVPWFVGLLVLGSVLFGVLNRWRGEEFTPGKAPTPSFNPVVYTLDLLVPPLGLGQHDVWVTSGAAQSLAWIFTVLGWVLAAALAAGLTQAVRKG